MRILQMEMSATVNEIARWLNYLGAIPMIILGIIGSFLTVVVFTKRRSFRHNPTTTYLLANAIITGIHLPTIYSQSILVDGFLLGVFNTNDVACREHNYLFYVTTVSAISFPCWAAFDQYAATSREASFRHRWSSLRFVRLAIVGTVLFWTVAYIPMLFFSGIVNGRCGIANEVYRKLINYCITPLVYTILPFVFIVFFTRGTIRNLRATTLTNRRHRLMKQIRRMLIPQLAILGISGFPFSLEVIYLEVTNDLEKDSLRQAIENVGVQLVRLFYHCNFVCTFYIYLYMSSDVRKVLGQTFRCRWRKNEIQPLETSGGNSITLQTLNYLRSGVEH